MQSKNMTATTARHALCARGLEAAGKSPSLEGAKFGRLFPRLPAGRYGSTEASEHANLHALAELMVSKFDPPRDGPDDEESGIPALYTYLGQFIDHDLTFDPNSSFIKVKDPDAMIDFRTPAFDLDNLYGRGPGDQPYMYDEDGKSLLLGDDLSFGSRGARDLQRNGSGRALIGDPRNDENAIVSQLQGLMIRFHNKQVKKNPYAEFSDIQASVRHHYQYVVVNDFLARIVNARVLEELKTNGRYDRHKIKFFNNFAPPYGLPYMPLEFSVASYRFGHSMIRPAYRLNDITLLPIFPLPSKVQPGFPQGLTGFRRMITDWGIDWGRFIDIDVRSYGFKDGDTQVNGGSQMNGGSHVNGSSQDIEAARKEANFKRMQLAYRIDTALVDPLRHLPVSVAGNRPPSLAFRNLQRGVQFGLPTGQQVAEAMGIDPLDDDLILIGQAIPGQPLVKIADVADGVFAGNCPLWTYVLAEAMQNKANPDPKLSVIGDVSISTPQLGPVGGRIVAEVFLGLLFADKGSYLNLPQNWHPPHNPHYQLKDLVIDALTVECD